MVGWLVGGWLVGRWNAPRQPDQPYAKTHAEELSTPKRTKQRKKCNVQQKRVFEDKSGGKQVKVARPEGRLGHSGVTHLLPTGSKAALSYDLGKVLGVRFFGQKLSKKQGYGRSRCLAFSLLYGGLGFGLGSRLTKRFSAIDCLPSRLVDRPEFCSYVFGL